MMRTILCSCRKTERRHQNYKKTTHTRTSQCIPPVSEDNLLMLKHAFFLSSSFPTVSHAPSIAHHAADELKESMSVGRQAGEKRKTSERIHSACFSTRNTNLHEFFRGLKAVMWVKPETLPWFVHSAWAHKQSNLVRSIDLPLTWSQCLCISKHTVYTAYMGPNSQEFCCYASAGDVFGVLHSKAMLQVEFFFLLSFFFLKSRTHWWCNIASCQCLKFKKVRRSWLCKCIKLSAASLELVCDYFTTDEKRRIWLFITFNYFQFILSFFGIKH